MRASNPSDGADRRPPEEDASATARRGAAARPPRPIEEDRPADLREAGADVRAVAVIVDRATGARERIEAAGLPYYAALGLADLGLE